MLQRIKSQINVSNFVIIGIIIIFFWLRIRSVDNVSALSSEALVVPTEAFVSPYETPALVEVQVETEEPITQGTLKVYNAELGRYIAIDEFNTMDQDHLMMFKGVGEVTAKAILTHISTVGALVYYEDLLDIKGIGPKKLEKILNEKP